MKIAIVVPGGVDRSGTERVIPALLAFIARVARAHETHVFALAQEPRPAQWTLRGATVHNAGRPGAMARTAAAIVREHRRGPIDVVHAFWVVPAGLAAALAAHAIRRPLAVHVAGGELAMLPEIGYGGSRSARGRGLVHSVLRCANAVTAASGPMLDALARTGIQARRIPLGVALDEWPPLAPRPRALNRPARLVHVASVNEVKDQTTLLRAAARLAAEGVDFTLDIVGGDTLDGALHAHAVHLELVGRVVFHGFVPHAEVRDIVAAADQFLLSSLHEAGPVAVLEAAAVGVPTVGTNVGHLADWTPQAAVTVPCGDDVALATATAALLRDDDRRIDIARHAHRIALEEDADHTARSMLMLYDTLAGSAAGAPLSV